MATSQKAANKERYDMLRRMLEDRRREIQDKLRSLREHLPEEVTTVRDPEEQSVSDFVRDVDFALMQMKSETLAKIDDALSRLDNGTYGICEDCGEPIAENRLKAVPFAALCRDCQELREQEESFEKEARASETRLGADFSLPPLR
jgi:DnaK suppressor protein